MIGLDLMERQRAGYLEWGRQYWARRAVVPYKRNRHRYGR